MKVKDLAYILTTLDQDYEVRYFWDGDARSSIEVITADEATRTIVLGSDDEYSNYYREGLPVIFFEGEN